MTDQECVRFLKWALPELHMRWNGFHRVRGQVCKRISARMQELGLSDQSVYRAFLEGNSGEWPVLDSLCRVTISRFFRDREVFLSLAQDVLVRLSRSAVERGDAEFRCWSIGCASGEEPYTFAILWDRHLAPSHRALKMTVIATDSDRGMLQRAQEGCYFPGSLRELPEDGRSAFLQQGDRFCIRGEEREKVTLLEQDIRQEQPGGLFHIILCRNIVFTYFDRELQNEILAGLLGKLVEGGALVLGIHEALPPGTSGFLPWPGCRGVYRKSEPGARSGSL